MRIIIAGAGEVGFHLAKLLAYEDHDIVLIDTDQEKLKLASSSLDVGTVHGNASSPKMLREAKYHPATNSLVFMFDCVPEPVCQTTSGN